MSSGSIVSIKSFRRKTVAGAAVTVGASRWQRLGGRVRLYAGAFLNHWGCPAHFQAVTIHDEVSGQTIAIETGRLFSKLTVNGRDFYFRRLTGRYDGSGSSLT